jgi:hypothetical protein
MGHQRNQGMEISKCQESKKNENTTFQNVWDKVKTLLRGRFIATNAYIKIREISNNLVIHLKFFQKDNKLIPELVERKKERI